MADTKISALTNKAVPVAADIIPILDSAAGNANKRATVGTLYSGGSPTTTQGDIVKRGASVDQRLAAGAKDYQLYMQDIGAGVLEPRWGDPYIINASQRGIVPDGSAGSTAGTDDTGTDWTTALQALLTEAGNRTQGWASGRMGGRGAIVQLGTGVYRTGPLTIPAGVGLIGQGKFSTVLKLKDGANASFITNTASPDQIVLNSHYIRIEHLALHCNGDNQTGSARHGISLSVNPSFGGKATQDWGQDVHHTIRDLIIYRPRGNGINVAGLDESRLWHVLVSDAVGYGFVTSFDAFWISCTAYNSGLSGFYVSSHSVRLVNCKSFSNGTITAASGHGFETAPGILGTNIINCEAQDNRAAGFYINGSRIGIYQGLVADSNSVRGLGSNAGVEIQGAASGNLIDFVAYDRGAGAPNGQQNALFIGSSATKNTVRIGGHETNNASGGPIAVGPAIKSGSTTAGNTVEVLNQNGYQDLGNTGAATITVDPYAGATVKMTLTGNITMAAPSNGHVGCPLTITFVQDGTGGRKITWPSSSTQFIHTWMQNLTAGNVTTISFIFDGTNWVQVAPMTTMVLSASPSADSISNALTGAQAFATTWTIPKSQLKAGQTFRLTLQQMFTTAASGTLATTVDMYDSTTTTQLVVSSNSNLTNSMTDEVARADIMMTVRSLSGVSGAAGVTATCDIQGIQTWLFGTGNEASRKISPSGTASNTVSLATDADQVIQFRLNIGVAGVGSFLRHLLVEQMA